MYVWLINHYAVPPEYYPLARQTYFARNLIQMGHKVTIISASSVHNSNINLITGSEKWRRETVDGIDHVYIKCCNYNGNGIRRIYNMFEFAWKLPSVCRLLDKPDAIVSTSMPPMSCAKGIRIAKAYGIPGIAEIADLWPESLIIYGYAKKKSLPVFYLRRLEKWIYENADNVVFTMEAAYDYIIEQHWEKEVPIEKVSYINNGIDLELFDYNRDHYKVNDSDLLCDDRFKIIYTGSIRRVNNVGRLLDIAKKIEEKNILFLIYGDGDELDELKDRIKREGIKNVIFKGRVDKKFIPFIVSNADLNIIHGGSNETARYGTSQNKMFDYLAAGRPIVRDTIAKHNPIVRYNAGFETEGNSIDDVVLLIMKLYRMPANERAVYGANARKAACDYDFKVLTKKLLSVIYRCMDHLEKN